MKKLIFIALVLGFTFSPVAPIRAQVATSSEPMTVEQIQSLLNQLTTIVLDLMQQLADLRAGTPADDPAVGSVETSLDEPLTIPELIAGVEVDVPESLAGATRVDAGGTVSGLPVRLLVSGNWDVGILKIKDSSGLTLFQQPAQRGSERFENWRADTVYNWTLTYSRGEETKTLTGSFTTPSN
jgi:hypothetical protein